MGIVESRITMMKIPRKALGVYHLSILLQTNQCYLRDIQLYNANRCDLSAINNCNG